MELSIERNVLRLDGISLNSLQWKRLIRSVKNVHEKHSSSICCLHKVDFLESMFCNSRSKRCMSSGNLVFWCYVGWDAVDQINCMLH